MLAGKQSGPKKNTKSPVSKTGIGRQAVPVMQKGSAISSPLSAVANSAVGIQSRPAVPAFANPIKPNHTGLPDHIKNGAEHLSGVALDDVKVHYHSDKPKKLNAHAYAQGPNIFVAPGQEKHLGHEAWHVVQQKQGRVKPAIQMKGVAINNDSGLEREADIVGTKIIQPYSIYSTKNGLQQRFSASANAAQLFAIGQVVQLIETTDDKTPDPTSGIHALTKDILSKILEVYKQKLSKLGQELKNDPVTVIWELINAFDIKYLIPVVDKGIKGITSWLLSKVASVPTWIIKWLGIAYTALAAVHTIFTFLPEPLQNLIIFKIGSGFRSILSGFTFAISAETADIIVDKLFVSDPEASYKLLFKWITDFNASPTKFLTNLALGYLTIAEPANADAAPAKTGVKNTGNVTAEKEAAEKLNTMLSVDRSMLKLNLGKPKLQRNKLKKDAKGADIKGEKTQVGGLVFPFNFSINFFNEKLEVPDKNELVLPWDGGFNLVIEKAELGINKDILGVIYVGSIALNDINVTNDGLQKMSVILKDFNIAKQFPKTNVTINWDKKGGTSLKTGLLTKIRGEDVKVDMTMIFGADGKFSNATLTVAARDKLEIMKGVISLEKYGGAASLSKSGDFAMSVHGDITSQNKELTFDAKGAKIIYASEKGFELSAALIHFEKEGLTIEVKDLAFEGSAIGAASANVGYSTKKKTEGNSSWMGSIPGFGESDLLNAVDFEAEFDINQPKFLFAKPWFEGTFTTSRMSLSYDPNKSKKGKKASNTDKTVKTVEHDKQAETDKSPKDNEADDKTLITEPANSLKAEINFKKKNGKVNGSLSSRHTLVDIPIPALVIPGAHLTVNIKVTAGVGAGLDIDLTKLEDDKQKTSLEEEKKNPSLWEIKDSKIGLKGDISAEVAILAGVGIALLAALEGGGYIKGAGKFAADLKAAGKFKFDKKSIKSDATSPIVVIYSAGPTITASAGIKLRAKYLFLFEKVLYEKELVSWNFGIFNIHGEATLNAETDKWESVDKESKFADKDKIGLVGLVAESEDNTQKLLLDASTHIHGSGEKRKELLEKLSRDVIHNTGKLLEKHRALELENKAELVKLMSLVLKKDVVFRKSVEHDNIDLKKVLAEFDEKYKLEEIRDLIRNNADKIDSYSEELTKVSRIINNLEGALDKVALDAGTGKNLAIIKKGSEETEEIKAKTDLLKTPTINYDEANKKLSDMGATDSAIKMIDTLMTPIEFHKASTTTGILGGENERKNILLVDNALKAYFAVKNESKAKQKEALTELLSVITVYLGHFISSRRAAVLLLEFQAIETLKSLKKQ